jgi:mutator protein MutT
MSEKHQVHVASYVIFRQENQILLTRRMNTGYHDGDYSLPSGHIENGEFPDQAAIREAEEEVGVKINEPKFVLVMYSDDNYACFFFEVRSWDGEIRNCEEDKCDDVQWFELDQLPKNLTPEVKAAIQNYQKQSFYANVEILKSAEMS